MLEVLSEFFIEDRSYDRIDEEASYSDGDDDGKQLNKLEREQMAMERFERVFAYKDVFES